MVTAKQRDVGCPRRRPIDWFCRSPRHGACALARLTRVDGAFYRVSALDSWAGREDLYDLARELRGYVVPSAG